MRLILLIEYNVRYSEHGRVGGRLDLREIYSEQGCDDEEVPFAYLSIHVPEVQNACNTREGIIYVDRFKSR